MLYIPDGGHTRPADQSEALEWRHPLLGNGGEVSWVVCSARDTWEQFETLRRRSCETDGPVN